MEHQETHFQHFTTPRSSTTLPSTAIVSSPPSLEPSESRDSSPLRKRTSWSQRLSDAGKDPLFLDSLEPPHSAAGRPKPSRPTLLTLGHLDDPFSTTEDRSFSLSARLESQYITMPTYPSSQAGPSSSSLTMPTEFGSDEGHREDDEAHLTANMSHNGAEEEYDEGDPESSPALTRRRTLRYSVSPSPLKKTGTALKSMSRNIRRASLRVVNLASTGLENQIRLGNSEDVSRGLKLEDKGPGEEVPLPDLNKVLPIRGRTLGCLGPESKLRLALFDFLVYP